MRVSEAGVEGERCMPTAASGLQWYVSYKRLLLLLMVWVGDGISGKRKLVLAVMETKKALLESQDLDGDGLITVEDQGSKV